ncbi:het domain protein [Stagonosporopsis vannaccii]|nr:het domain protein [Stagonosporopsis vannaccii]
MEALSDSLHAYRYQPLDLSKQQIRLIALNSASSPSEDITCSLKVFDADTAPYYVALSYTWGPRTPTRTIYIDGKTLDIRQNLYDFLLNYRNDASNVHFIWIDQICISQAHTGERNHQVQQMSRIYTHCLHAIIWLGQDSQDTALNFLTSPTQRLACTLLRNQYFNRLWIIQEIFLSPQARVLCGNVWLQVESLVAALRGIEGKELLPLDFIDFVLVDTWYWNLGLMPLETCLGRYATHECQDPRDKVYGLLSLIDKQQRIAVDYNKSTEEVFLDVALYLFRTSWRKT